MRAEKVKNKRKILGRVKKALGDTQNRGVLVKLGKFWETIRERSFLERRSEKRSSKYVDGLTGFGGTASLCATVMLL